MADLPPSKRVLVHIGPHKTGSTALQVCLTANREILKASGVLILHDSTTHKAAMCLAQEDFAQAERLLVAISHDIAKSDCPIAILSQEDFSGDLPGRSRQSSVYPKLMKNLRIIARSLQPHTTEFLFFQRDEKSWLTSCYVQSLKHRTRFCSFEEFLESIDGHFTWSEKLERPVQTFRERFIMVQYQKNPDAGLQSVLKLLKLDRLALKIPPEERNTSPSPEKTRLLERINRFSSFKATAWFSKSLVLKDWAPETPAEMTQSAALRKDALAALAFPRLIERAQRRTPVQRVSDVLPPTDTDLEPLLFRALPADTTMPEVSRARMEDQSIILDYHFRGKSELAKLNALSISYLRRDTKHTAKARRLFHRIWNEQGHVLVNELPTRWLISTLQTFLDHGANEAQRLIGASGHFYGNMMKIYEGERALDGLEQDAVHEKTCPFTPNRFAGLDRYEIGGTDLLLNTNALALDVARMDDVAGLVLIEFLLRVQASGNVFTRLDKTRKIKGINVPNFVDTWSFYQPPS